MAEQMANGLDSYTWEDYTDFTKLKLVVLGDKHGNPTNAVIRESEKKRRRRKSGEGR